MFAKHSRVWNQREKKFEYTDTILASGDVYSTKTGRVFHRSRFPVMEFTGLHDHYGRSIWIHDQLQDNEGRTYLIEADPKKGFVGTYRRGFKKVVKPLDYLIAVGCAKIGNAYDMMA